MKKSQTLARSNPVQVSSMVLGLITITIVTRISSCLSQEGNCDLSAAKRCSNLLHVNGDSLTHTAAAATDTGTLCMHSVESSNFTRCLQQTTAHCKLTNSISNISWNSSDNQIHKLCDSVCPNFLQRVVNITSCSHNIVTNPNISATFGIFCQAINQTLQCAIGNSTKCAFGKQLIRLSLPREIENLAMSVCRKECKDVDVSLERLTTCQKHMDRVLDKTDCTSLESFKDCLKENGVPGCPVLESVVNATYPEHIYGPVQKMCRKTPAEIPSKDQCQKLYPEGYTLVQQCLQSVVHTARHFKRNDKLHLNDVHCWQYQLAQSCLETSEIGNCPFTPTFQKQIENTELQYFQKLKTFCRKKRKNSTNAGSSQQVRHVYLSRCSAIIVTTTILLFGY